MSRTPASTGLTRPGFEPGLFLLQGTRLEDLADTVLAWLERYPPGVLEEDAIIVPSNGVGEWFKAHTAKVWGICAGLRVELPARFVWRVTEAMTGPSPAVGSHFEKATLAWWLLGQLSELKQDAHWQGILPVGDGDAPLTPDLAAYRWCRRVADLYDQYQVYRADWLLDWEAGLPALRQDPDGPASVMLPPDQQWQAQLWSHLVAHGEGVAPRHHRHRECLNHLTRLGRDPGNRSPSDDGMARPDGSNSIDRRIQHLPARIVVLVCGHLPPQTLELLAALSHHRAVMLAVLNPCLSQWVDLAEGIHGGQPLLAAWGGQMRDVIRQIERFDERLAQVEGRSMGRAEREDTPPPSCALERLQEAIRLNEPVQQTAADPQVSLGASDDGSLRFHITHSALRELEVLHDHLLSLLDAAAIEPHQIVVMVPDLDRYTPAIQAVFGQHGPQDERFIPWGLGDRRSPVREGVAAVIEWLLSLPTQRATLDDWDRLAACSAFEHHWSLGPEDRERLAQWLESAGVRWGLDDAHRRALGLPAMGEANTWRFGARRMLAGHALGPDGASSEALGVLGPAPVLRAAASGAHGEAPGVQDVAPLAAVHGLGAQAAGAFSAVTRRLSQWQVQMHVPAPAASWAQRLRDLLADLFDLEDETDGPVFAAFDRAISDWLNHSSAAADLLLPWPLVHEALMQLFVEPLQASSRFQAAGVTFCTLMPLRAVPFEMVCLLGMNDGDYPRPSVRAGDDLMSLPGMRRPGDRARQSDDRQLMLDALMAARRRLVVSWIGRTPQDNQEQPPSVLVGHLRDTVASIWGTEALRAVTFEYPMQAFSPRYFQAGSGLETYAREWEPSPAESPSRALPAVESPVNVVSQDVEAVERWLLHPVAEITRSVLDLQWPRETDPREEDEVLSLQGLAAWSLRRRAATHLSHASAENLEAFAQRVIAEGRLPLGAPGRMATRDLIAELHDWLLRIGQARSACDPLSAAEGDPSQPPQVLILPSRLRLKSGAKSGWRDALLVPAWWRQCTAAAAGQGRALLIVAADGTWKAPAPSIESASQVVAELTEHWRENLRQGTPWPADARAVDAPLGSVSAQVKALNELADRDPAWRRSFGTARDWAWTTSASSAEGYGHDIPSWQQATERLYAHYRQWRNDALRPFLAEQEVSQAEESDSLHQGDPSGLSLAGGPGR